MNEKMSGWIVEMVKHWVVSWCLISTDPYVHFTCKH